MMANTPSRAPPGTPKYVAQVLDMASIHLAPVVERGSLDLKAYDLICPDIGTWAHHLYGKVWDREFAIQIAAYDQETPTFRATISCFVKLIVSGGEDWLGIEFRNVTDMDGLLTCVKDYLKVVHTVCALRMPHVCEPDAKA